ncbi:MAG: YybS family protein [Alicyclobacillus sp.]|nr:YybS family protein [Alicyclobacillus sp.]
MNRSHLGERSAWAALAVFALLVGLAVCTPLTGLVVWLLPAPLVALSAGPSRALPIVLSVLAGVLLWMSGYGLASAVFAIGFYFVGWAMGEAIRHSAPPEEALVLGTLVFVMLGLVELALFRWSGADLSQLLVQQSALSATLYQPLLGMSNAEVSAWSVSLAQTILRLLPALLVIAAFFGALLNYVAAYLILSMQARYQRPPLLSVWRTPVWVGLAYILALAGMLVQTGTSPSYGWDVVDNAALLAGFFVLIQGIAMVWRRVRRWPLRYLWLFLLGVVATVTSTLFIFLGLLDALRLQRMRRLR